MYNAKKEQLKTFIRMLYSKEIHHHPPQCTVVLWWFLSLFSSLRVNRRMCFSVAKQRIGSSKSSYWETVT